MRNTNLNIILTTIFLSFLSCIEVIEPDIEFRPKLVMESNFSSNHELEVEVTSTREVGSLIKSTFVDFAKVEVFRNDVLIEELTLREQGTINEESQFPKYISKDFFPKVGVSYTIKVSAAGFDSIEATSMIPEGSEVESILFDNTINIDNPTQTFVNFNIEILINDQIGIGNYYHIKFYQRLVEFEVMSVSDGGEITYDTTRLDTKMLANLSINLTENEYLVSKFIDGQSIFISDETFDGEEINLEILGGFSFNSEKYLLDGGFFVEVRSVPFEYYDYYTSVIQSQAAKGDIGTDPTEINSNVLNGTGIFAGFNPTVNTFSLTGN